MLGLGLRLPQRTGEVRRDVVEVARAAEELGYTSLWTYERLLFPDSPADRGPRAVIEPATVRPKPASPIPIMLAEDAARSRALERMATDGDGRLPVVGPGQFEATARTGDQIRQLAAARGRDAGKMELIVVGNVTFADRPLGDDRVPFTGTVDHVIDDIGSAAAAGADEVIIDLSLQPWFSTTARMLEVAQEIHERVREART